MKNRTSNVPIHHSSVLNNTFRYQLGSAIIISILQLITLYFLGRKVSALQLGIFGTYQMIFRFSFAIFEPGMYSSIIQKLEFNSRLVETLTKYQLLIFGALSVFLIGLFYPYWIKMDVETLVLILAIILSGTIAKGSLYHVKLIYANRQFEVAILITIAHIIEFISLFILLNLTTEIYSFAISLLIRFLFFYSGTFLLSRKYVSNINHDEINNKVHTSYSAHYCLNQGLSYVQGIYDNVLIALLFGQSVFGIYILACEMSYFVFSKVNPIFNKAFFPVLSSKVIHKEKTSDAIHSVLLSFLFITTPIYIFLFSQSESILFWLFPDKYQQMIIIYKYFLIIAFIKSITNILFTVILSYGKSKEIFYWNISVAIFNYSALVIFYFIKITLEPFMIFMILYALLVLAFTIYKLNEEEKILELADLVQYIRYVLYSGLLFLSAYILKQYKLSLIYVILIFFGFTVISVFVVYKEKLINLLKFKIA